MAQPFEDYIYIKGARVHNLKNVSVQIPRNRLVVITGLSGSGKSSLAFDTLFAEGQRRYVESLSSYVRQFLGRINKPEVDAIEGISPAIAIEQKTISRNPRSTVGTSTEIYEYIKLLFARVGHTFSPISGEEVTRHSVSNVVSSILSFDEGSRIIVLAPLYDMTYEILDGRLDLLLQQGFSRVYTKGAIFQINDLIGGETLPTDIDLDDFSLLVDRLIVRREDSDFRLRLTDSIETAFHEGEGRCKIVLGEEIFTFSNRFEKDGMEFTKPSTNFFSFNSPYGACSTCDGFGMVVGVDPNMVIPDTRLSVYDNAVACWRGVQMSEWKQQVIAGAAKVDFPIHRPYDDLSEAEKKMLWDGCEAFEGIHQFFQFVESQLYKVQYRVLLARYRGKKLCDACNGSRIREDALYVKVGGVSIADVINMSIEKLYVFIENLELSGHEQKVANRLLVEVKNRLGYLISVGLGYLSLNRLSNSLSGGESQRILLSTSLGSALVGSMYILDEPSIGLHPRDTHRLIEVLKQLRDLGNTVVVVEHDEEIIRSADYLIDLGPMAGYQGGEIVFAGTIDEIQKTTMPSFTAKYLSGELKIPTPSFRRQWKDFIQIDHASENNLKNITVKFPLHTLTVICGVSGSGKTSLVKQTLYPALLRALGAYSDHIIGMAGLQGDFDTLSGVELVDQHPIGRSTRSNPATYLKAYDDIRALYVEQPLSKQRDYKAGFFSFNMPGGRCETCLGEGTVAVSMQFMADVHLVCEACEGKRFKEEVLEVLYQGKTISDVLNMTIDEASLFFEQNLNTATKRILSKLQALKDVGLGYLKMGQSSASMSGGEIQRIKLAFFLSKGVYEKPILFIFDEPSTGLHIHDILKLNASFDALIEKGHSVIVIEHHPDIIKIADWVIEIGPEGGEQGGHVIFEGTPEKMMESDKSITAPFLKEKLR